MDIYIIGIMKEFINYYIWLSYCICLVVLLADLLLFVHIYISQNFPYIYTCINANIFQNCLICSNLTTTIQRCTNKYQICNSHTMNWLLQLQLSIKNYEISSMYSP